MKTLDEVIDNFEKACDLEQRCEGCSGCLGQEYGCPNDGAESVPDALHYLKVLKDILDPLKVKKITHEITCPWCQSKIAILLPESNDPLTWDELRKMEGKPVWIEADDGKYKGWVIVGKFYSLVEEEDLDAHVDLYYFGRSMEYSKEMYGYYWQAYRKERK